MKIISFRRSRGWGGDRGAAEAIAALAVALFLLTSALLFLGPWAGGVGDMMDGGMMGSGGMMGGGRNTADSPVTTGSDAATVVIKSFAYSPGNLRVPVGTTVTWRNEDAAPHTATAQGQRWDTGMLSKGQQASVTFAEAGDYTYYCAAHPEMKARLQVQ